VNIVEKSNPAYTNELKNHISQVKLGVFEMKMRHILHLFFRNEGDLELCYITFSSPYIEYMVVTKYNLQTVAELRTFLILPTWIYGAV
jgi:hypothetical protein